MTHYLVIKCGGSVFDKLTPEFFKSLQIIQESGKWQPVIVHGGGPAISQMLDKMEIPTVFHHGLRVTTQEVLDVAEMVLSGTMNKQIVSKIAASGGKAIGLSGVDGGLFLAKPTSLTELGYVGEITSVDAGVIRSLAGQGFIPVVSPISMDEHGQHLNINADQAAASLAVALNGKLCFISDVPGILVEKDGALTPLKQVSNLEIEQMIELKKISGGMIPKAKAAVDSLKKNVKEVVIVNGMMPDCLIDYTNGVEVGTKIFLEEEILHA
ncbi:acetylglutamate kinase [Sporolactobacillus terrae]|uniref:Acetylglutamate kinase n=1 Tax=Sporolactobacillus terrae TaxID=269673 RepID=A0ABX5QAA4_9BACL|nr:acetylglutamate kinase [Sporolactobacillus terrae]QAA23599.1 acetylglutamate kinase [Sporolactobacillus terrae]QAA26569.1 acetylglutamate kinase [Sporolactobacillus terrae]UAK15640.1 acetylglutamate kinase [Sporolactobacillus terrae]